MLMSPDAQTARNALRDMCWRYEIDLKALCEELIIDWPTLQQVAQDPLMTVGAHTIDHHNLAVVDAELLEAEVAASAKLLEAAMGARPRFFAYPYGFGQAVNQTAVSAVQRAGYDAAFTTMPDTLHAGYADQLAALPRVSVNGLYQRLKYIDVLTSGVAFKLKNRGSKIAIPA